MLKKNNAEDKLKYVRCRFVDIPCTFNIRVDYNEPSRTRDKMCERQLYTSHWNVGDLNPAHLSQPLPSHHSLSSSSPRSHIDLLVMAMLTGRSVQ